MKDVPLNVTLKYYKQLNVQQALVKAAENKEVAVVYGSKGYGKRPDILKYPNDVLTLAKNGATSFHCSEEHWNNPLQLQPGLSKNDLDELRIGWDLVLDIDCKWLEYSKIAAHLLVEARRYNDIKNVFVKFSGNHGFHIAVPFKAFPDNINGIETKNLFPEGPRKIAAHLKTMITHYLAAEIMKYEGNNWENIKQKTGLGDKELKNNNGQLNVESILVIDTVLISSRHLYRMPYSLNEKSGLASIPITPEEIQTFDKEKAKPEDVKIKLGFLDNKTEPNEAKKLLVAAFDAAPTKEEQKIVLKEERKFEGPTTAVPEQYFPPCIKLILEGLQDGKKRSLFVLLNFLTSCGWENEAIEKLITEWNKKNPEPLRETILQTHLKYHKDHKKKMLPPNCANVQYYQDLHICKPDNFCKKIKNPANYAVFKQKIMARENDSPKPPQTNKNADEK